MSETIERVFSNHRYDIMLPQAIKTRASHALNPVDYLYGNRYRIYGDVLDLIYRR